MSSSSSFESEFRVKISSYYTWSAIMQHNNTCFGLQSKMAESRGKIYLHLEVNLHSNTLSFGIYFLLFSLENGLASNKANICEQSFYLGQRDRRKRPWESSMCSSVNCS